jgi:hypothetical protein
MISRRIVRLTLLAVALATGATFASILTQNSIHRITRGTLNSGDTARPQSGAAGVRMFVNAAEPVCSGATLTNTQHRLRVGLLHPATIASTGIVAANPPTDNPYVAGQQPFRDVLQDVFCLGQPPIMVPQGIGGALTLPEGPISYSPIHVTFSAPVALTPQDVSINCSYTVLRPCPNVSAVTQIGSGQEYTIRLSGPIPPGGCTSFTFNNINPAGQAPVLRYEFLPGDVNMSGASGDGVNTADLVALVHALQDGTANLPGNLARYDINRNGAVNTEDLLRLVQILNGVCSTRAWNGAVLVPCP